MVSFKCSNVPMYSPLLQQDFTQSVASFLKREKNGKKGEKGETFYISRKNYLFNIRSDSNVLIVFFFLILYWCFSEKGEKMGSFLDFILKFLWKKRKKMDLFFAQPPAMQGVEMLRMLRVGSPRGPVSAFVHN